jgi:transposase-like protein
MGYRNEIDYGRAIIASEVTEWLKRFRVYLILLQKPDWQLGLHYGGYTIGAVALQLAMAVANSEVFTCAACSDLYFRGKRRKPNTGQQNFCESCVRQRKPQQQAEARYRESRREARRLAKADVPVREIANRLNKTTTAVRRLLKDGGSR